MTKKYTTGIYFLGFFMILCVMGSLIGFFGNFSWLFDLFVHFRLYYLIVGIFGLIISTRIKNKLIALGAVSLVFTNVYVVFPVYGAPFGSDTSGSDITFVSLNVNHDVISTNQLVELITRHSADVAIFAETSAARIQDVQNVLGDDYLSKFALRTGWKDFGVGVIAKQSIEPVLAIRDLANNGITSISGIFTKDTRTCSFEGIHTMYPFGALRTKDRNDQLYAVAEKVNNVSCSIVMGDMNITPWSTVFAEVLEKGDLRDSRDGFGLQLSWPIWLPYFLRIPIDHALIGNGVQVIERKVLEPIGSDHLPLLLKVAF